MKHGKNPTVRQKKFMSSLGLNCDDWLVCQDTPKLMVLCNRHSKEEKTIEKGKQ